jgi:nucleoside 2-deoxyribosyltransferase
MPDPRSLYLASPLGFSEVGRIALDAVRSALRADGLVVVDPWELNAGEADTRRIGERNADAIRETDILIAVLDGADVDSGVAAEVGFACALGRKVIGYRGDLRLSGESVEDIVNLQVAHFIRTSGGTIVRSLAELRAALAAG